MRIEKVAILNEVVDRVKASDYCFILNYGGVSVDKVAKLRAALRARRRLSRVRARSRPSPRTSWNSWRPPRAVRP